MGVVTMLKLAGYYLYSRTDLVRYERLSVLEITFLVDVYRCHRIEPPGDSFSPGACGLRTMPPPPGGFVLGQNPRPQDISSGYMSCQNLSYNKRARACEMYRLLAIRMATQQVDSQATPFSLIGRGQEKRDW